MASTSMCTYVRCTNVVCESDRPRAAEAARKDSHAKGVQVEHRPGKC